MVSMFTARKKIQKDKGLEPTEFEDVVAQVYHNPLYCVFFFGFFL